MLHSTIMKAAKAILRGKFTALKYMYQKDKRNQTRNNKYVNGKRKNIVVINKLEKKYIIQRIKNTNLYSLIQ